MMRRAMAALTLALASAACASVPGAGPELEAIPAGVWGFTVEVEGVHQFADGRQERYVERVTGTAQVSPEGRIEVLSPRHGVDIRAAPTSLSSSFLRVRPGDGIVRPASLQVEELRRVRVGERCIQYAPPEWGDQAGRCLARDHEYVERYVSVSRGGVAWFHPLDG